MLKTVTLKTALLTTALGLALAAPAAAMEKSEFRVAWSIYVG